MTGPMVSVILPAYDQPEFLRDAIRSVAVQTMGDLELLVVDDGSPTDSRSAFLDAARGDPRMRYLRQANAGGAAARNRGIADARGAWLAFLDHDDRWLPRKLELQLAAARAWSGAPAGLVFCRMRRFGDRSLDARESAPFPPSARSGWLLPDLLRTTLIRTLSVVVVRRDALPPGATWFRTDLAIANDVELYYRLAERHPSVFVPEVLVEKRDHDRNASSDALPLHLEALRVVDELGARLGTGATPEIRALVRDRRQRHLLGAARAAHRRGETAVRRQCCVRAIRNRPVSLRPWLGLAASLLGV